MATYYAQRKTINAGTAVTPNNRFGTRPEMERQFHLYCASAATNADNNDVDSCEWGTIEQGILERKVWVHQHEPEQPELDGE